MTLPPNLREAAEANAPIEVCWCAGPTCSGCENTIRSLWMRACEWLYGHLLKGAPEFDEKAARNAAARATDHPEAFEHHQRGARWQHAQDAALIAQARAERDGIARDLEMQAKLRKADCAYINQLCVERDRLRKALERWVDGCGDLHPTARAALNGEAGE